MKSPVSRIVPKTLRSPLCSQNVSFLVKLRGGFDKNKPEKSCMEKTPVFKEEKFGYCVLRKLLFKKGTITYADKPKFIVVELYRRACII